MRDASAPTHSPSMSNWVGRSGERTVVGRHKSTLRRGLDALREFDVHGEGNTAGTTDNHKTVT
ncbi:hypothetical protein E5345_09145 [Propionibacterium sp. NM47_B9-13]|nr:hypothetical protein HMPREF9621_02699 [Cutibacterium modestum HL037PA2]EFT14127.1 hypothetical protein HMPREF9622_02894 [Cutibacterium modestum HL037PA3]REB73199.1 hypothetical protein CP877_12030 [Cutibacterium modestum]TGY28235.1 hypothetical protein E5345_09145 [Propionibacterium sp. NM47_B9-13]